jgi:hypothetical protein
MGTREGPSPIADVRVEFDLTGDPPPFLEMGLAPVSDNRTAVPGQLLYVGNNQEVSISSNDVTSESPVNMQVAWAVDENQDGFLQPSELQSGHFDSRIVKVVGPASQAFAKAQLEKVVSRIKNFMPTASNWLYCFLNDLGASQATNTPSSLETSDPELDHHVGAAYTGQTAPINLAVFAPSSTVATEIGDSSELQKLIFGAIASRKASLISQLGAELVQKSFDITLPDGGINFSQGIPGDLVGKVFRAASPFEADLHYSIGNASVSNIHVSFKAIYDNQYLRVIPTVTCQVSDLYDFCYDDGGLSTFAAEVEAGYVQPGEAGHVFKEQINVSVDMPQLLIPR